MAKKIKQLTPNQLAFKKELKRLQQAVRRAEKKGYIFEDNFLPQMPKRVTSKALNKIKEYKTPQIYKYAQKVDYETGELTKGTKAREIENKERAKKAVETRKRNARKKIDKNIPPIQIPDTPTEKFGFSDVIISNFLAELTHFPQQAYPLMKEWVDRLIRQYGKDDVADMLQQAKQEGMFIDYTVAYDRQKLLGMMADMMEFLPDASEWFKQDLTDALESEENWNDIIED